MLGGVFEIANGDFDNVTYPTGLYNGKNWANNPIGQGYTCSVFYQRLSDGIKETVYRKNIPDRVRWYNGSSWGTWNIVYDASILADSSVLSPLASALGVGILKRSPASGVISDMDNIAVGTYAAATTAGTLNMPTDAPASTLFFFCLGDNGDGCLVIGGRDGDIYVRIKAYSVWSSWRKLQVSQ